MHAGVACIGGAHPDMTVASTPCPGTKRAYLIGPMLDVKEAFAGEHACVGKKRASMKRETRTGS